MKRALSLILSLALCAGMMAGLGQPRAADGRESAPDVYIQDNRLYLQGETTTFENMLRNFDVRYVPAKDAHTFSLATLNTDSSYAENAYKLYLDPLNIQFGSYIELVSVSMVPGDVLYIAYMDYDAVEPGLYAQITLSEQMLAMTTTQNPAQLPKLAVTASTLTITPGNRYTQYEYAVIPAVRPADFTPAWILAGSAAQQNASAIKVSLQPRAGAYTLRVRVQGDDRAGFYYASITGITTATPIVSLELEALGPLVGGKNGETYYFSSDGGSSYKTVFVAPNEEFVIDLSKVFGKKEVQLILKKASGDKDPKDITGALLQRSVNARADFPKEAKPQAYVSAKYTENFTLSGLSGEKLEARLPQTAQYISFLPSVGLPLLSAAEQAMKKKAMKIEFRVAANTSTMTPASAPKKITQPKQTKAPTVKVDYKKEIIKLKGGVSIAYADAPTADPSTLKFSQVQGDEISVSDAITTGKVMYFYLNATEKKSRSAIQRVKFAPRHIRPDNQEGLVVEKGKLKLTKGFEVYAAEKGKWGSFPKGEKVVSLRRKADAKYNKKTGASTGNAASVSVTAKVAYDKDGKTVLSAVSPDKLSLSTTGISYRNVRNSHVDVWPNDNAEIYVKGRTLYAISITSPYDNIGDSRTCDFSLSIAAPYLDGERLAETVKYCLNGETVSEDQYTCVFRSVSVGDEVTFVLTPKDPDNYRETTYKFVVGLPFEDTPYSVTWNVSGTRRSEVTVRLPQNLYAGETARLQVKLIKVVNGVDTTVVDRQETRGYDPTGAANNNFTIDFTSEITRSGVGRYLVRVQRLGTAGLSQNSGVVSSSNLLVYESDLQLTTVTLSEAAAVRQDTVLSVDKATDGLGNDLLSTATFQWVTSDTDPSGAGTSIDGQTARAFTVPAGLEGKFIGVRVTNKNVSIIRWYTTVVTPAPGSP